MSHQSAVHKGCAKEVAPEGESRLDAALNHKVSTQRPRLEIAVLEDPRVTGRHIGPARARHIETVIPLKVSNRHGENAGTQLILAEAAHGMRASRVEALSRVKNVSADGTSYTERLVRAAERADPADTGMRSDHTAAPDLIERGSIRARAIVAEIRDRERGRVLDAPIGAIASVGSERIVGPVYRRRDREGRELLIAAQRFQCRLVADAVVDAEVHVTRVDLADLEAIVGAGRRAVGDVARESEARSVTAIDVDARCAAPMREETQ